jgi:DNA-3-methyladenine glycosylase
MTRHSDDDPILLSSFFHRSCAVVARDLLGRHLRRGGVVLRITETEAYLGPADTACHTARGRTPRNAAMWGPLGRAYVYRCYGLHWMLNVVCGAEGGGEAVLIRSAAPVAGEEEWLPRRGGRRDLAGPGKVAAALGIDRSFDHHDLTVEGGLELRAGRPATEVLRGPRVGIDSAAPADRDAPLRFAVAGEASVSARRTLSPETG